jgi:pimeloyl-ACP methyl ester carboxylesterase
MAFTTRDHVSTYFHWKHELETELEAGSKVIQADKGPIEYAIRGDEGPMVVGVHGAPGGYDQVLNVYPDMPIKGFRLLSWSRPGYLRTPLSVGRTIEEQADALASLLDALKINKVAILACSAGGPCSLEFAIRHPDRIGALIMECAVSQRYMINPAKKRQQLFTKSLFNDSGMWLYSVMARYATKSTIKYMIKMESNLDNKQVDVLTSQIMADQRKVNVMTGLIKSMCPISPRKAGLDNDLEQFARIGRLPLERITAPTLVIHGTNDADVPFHQAEFTANTIPNSELYVVHGGFHILPVSSNADEIAAKRIDFLKKHAPDQTTTGGPY